MIGFGLYLLFTVSYFLHLPSRVPVLGVLRVEVFIGVVLFLITVVSGSLGRAWSTQSPVFRRLAWLFLFIIISIPLVTWPGSVIRFSLLNYIKVVFFFLITVATIDSEKRLKLFVLVFLGCQLFRVFEPLYLHLTMGYWGDVANSHVGGTMVSLDRLAGAPNDIVNSNQLAWVIVSTIPFVYYLGLRSRTILLKALSIPVLGAMAYTLTLTGSRSGMVCLAVVILCIGWFGPDRGKRLAYMTVLLVPVVIVGLGKMDADMLTRYQSLFDSSVAGSDTAAGRVIGLESQLQTIYGNPLFGHGLGTSMETNYNVHGGQGQVTHNLYIEALQEIGVIGLALLLLYIRAIGYSLLRTYKALEGGTANTSYLVRLAQATLVWFVMDVIYSLSCFGLSSWEWYLFGGITHVCWLLGQSGAMSKQVVPAV